MQTPDALPSPKDAPRTRAWTLLAAAALLGLEGAALVVLGGYVAVEGFVGEPASVVYVVWIAGMALAAGAALGFVARGLVASRRWSRAPAVLTQLLVIAVAYEQLRDVPLIRGPLLVVAIAVLVLLLVRPTGEALRD